MIARIVVAVVAALLLFAGCGSPAQTRGGESNWLSLCHVNADCTSGLECACGLCTRSCSASASCSDLGSSATCAPRATLLSACPALPAGTAGLCLAGCQATSDCTAGNDCRDGACVRHVSDTTDAGSSDAATRSGSDGGTASDANAASDASAAGDAAAAEATAPMMVSLGDFPSAAPIGGYSNALVLGLLPPRCSTTEFGTCRVIDCLLKAGPVVGITGVSAGTVTVHGGTGADVVLSPDGFGVYAPYSDSAQRWHPGDVLQISASGSTVPAFASLLTFPTALALTSPDPTNLAAITIDRALGLGVTWVPTDETVTVGAEYYPVPGSFSGVQGFCDFPGAAGSATLPPELFTGFPPGSATLYAGHSRVLTQEAGTHPLRVLAINGLDSISITLP